MHALNPPRSAFLYLYTVFGMVSSLHPIYFIFFSDWNSLSVHESELVHDIIEDDDEVQDEEDDSNGIYTSMVYNAIMMSGVDDITCYFVQMRTTGVMITLTRRSLLIQRTPKSMITGTGGVCKKNLLICACAIINGVLGALRLGGRGAGGRGVFTALQRSTRGRERVGTEYFSAEEQSRPRQQRPMFTVQGAPVRMRDGYYISILWMLLGL